MVKKREREGRVRGNTSEVDQSAFSEYRIPNPESQQQLEQLRRVWQALGREDPLWAVLSVPEKRHGRWDRADFFATGEDEIASELTVLAAHGAPAQCRLAIDFGSGAGRLSRALASRFEQVIGLDISSSMVAEARTLNADIGNLTFRENNAPTLRDIADGSVDLVYSCMTLQHIPAALAEGYVAEFMRVLAPGGVAAFQFVTAPDTSWRGRLFAHLPLRSLNVLRRLWWRRAAVFEMHPLPESRLQVLLDARDDLTLLLAYDDGAAGRGWYGRRWRVMRNR